MASVANRPLNPIDVSQDALYVEDTWREPFAKLRAEMPISWREESPFGSYWSVVTHDLVQEVELRTKHIDNHLTDIDEAIVRYGNLDTQVLRVHVNLLS